MEKTPFLSVDQVADILEVSNRTVLNLIHRGRFPGAHKIDPESIRSPYRIPKPDLESYIAKQRGERPTL
ncbi:MAG: helix-turn-helix domain-containing protein [Anaerolineales bacterium]